ncbi:MAG TPA: 30S ribosomal protein S3 [Candidatus Aenigmarchaeota archaeon]|nr:MAG: 30S ribosomal protein S3 [Candidatus Aenigmarchaeota archaeon]HDD46075.1 30S ribosomal protein S3 [Candidatus Aenigmarchaeota archaeon]
MLLNKFFINMALRKVQIEDFIKNNFPSEFYSKIEIERTPLGVKIIIYTDRPGRIIGAGGKKINEMTEILKSRFNLENPQIDVKSIDNPQLDGRIMAKRIANMLEKGYNYKSVGNNMIREIMEAGAIGAQIVISGKLGGSKGRTAKFTAGYIKHCGQPAKDLVDYGFCEAYTKPGKIGIKVKIMKEFMDVTGRIKNKVDFDTIYIEEAIEENEGKGTKENE